MTDLNTFLDESEEALLPSDSETRSIADLAEALVKAELEVERVEAMLEAAKGERDRLEQVFLPDALAAAGVTEIKLLDGSKVEVKDVVACGLPKDPNKKGEALDWLANNDGAEIIDHAVTVKLKKGRDDEAKKALDVLREAGFAPEVTLGVHYQTLSSWAKEQIASGMAIPSGMFNLFVGKKAKIVKPKKEKTND